MIEQCNPFSKVKEKETGESSSLFFSQSKTINKYLENIYLYSKKSGF